MKKRPVDRAQLTTQERHEQISYLLDCVIGLYFNTAFITLIVREAKQNHIWSDDDPKALMAAIQEFATRPPTIKAKTCQSQKRVKRQVGQNQ